MSSEFEVAIVGGGIVGMASAKALVESGVTRVVVLEAEEQLAAHQTGHNSGVIHSGLYYKPGSLKSEFCRRGRDAMYAFCASEQIKHERCGKVVVAISEAELPRLAVLEERGRANGLQLKRLDATELRSYEPEVAGIAGLWVPETGIVNYGDVTLAFARRITRGGGEIRTGARVTAVRRQGGQVVVESTDGQVRANLLLNCAGLQSDRVARLCGSDPGVRIVPFRGEYYFLSRERQSLVRNLIYPVPDPELPFLGVHFTRTVDGRVEAGPNAVFALKREGYRWRDVSLRDLADSVAFPGFWRMARTHWRSGAGEMRRSLSKGVFVRSLQQLLPALHPEDVVRGGAGVRAQAVNRAGKLLDDFHIVDGEQAIHVLNAPSPAATASIVIGESLAERARKQLA